MNMTMTDTADPTIGILIASHNRKLLTLRCLESVDSQVLPSSVRVRVVLVDDGSTDGTSTAIRLHHPDVDVVTGSGQLFWNGAMRIAIERALHLKCDFILLLNDDTTLARNAIATMLETYDILARAGSSKSIIVGSVKDPNRDRVSYGGFRVASKWLPLKLERVLPADTPTPCDTFNANCVLIPRLVLDILGNLDGGFTHSMGDIDYGLRARKSSCGCWVAPMYMGECEINRRSDQWKPARGKTLDRWRKLTSVKGLPPKEWLLLTSRHGGFFWPLLWLNPYVRFWISSGVDALCSLTRSTNQE